MGIQDFPAVLQPIIQQGYLERAFRDALVARLGFRSIADREPIATNIGETVTKTRAGLLPVVTTPLNPANNTNFDNGLGSPVQWCVEQFTLTMNQYGIPMDLNTVTQNVGIAGRFVRNAFSLGENAMRTLDTLARDALYASYLGGNTRVRTTLGAPGTTVAVDDIRGFTHTWTSAGTPVAVSAQNTIAVLVDDTVYTCIGATADGSNVSTAPGGISGTLTFSGNVTVDDGTSGKPVIASTAPLVLRPVASGVMRATTAALVAGDRLKMLDQCSKATAIMRDNGVPTINGRYNCYLSNLQLQGLFYDDDFKLLYRGAYGSTEYKEGDVVEIMNLRFLPNNMAPQQTLAGQKVHRAIVCGQGALIEGEFAGAGAQETPADLHLEVVIDGIRLITREPVDRLKQIISQAWNWIGGYTVPTDITTNPNSIPTATNSAYKRAIVLESL